VTGIKKMCAHSSKGPKKKCAHLSRDLKKSVHTFGETSKCAHVSTSVHVLPQAHPVHTVYSNARMRRMGGEGIHRQNRARGGPAGRGRRKYAIVERGRWGQGETGV
jgi:hypothetical protein